MRLHLSEETELTDTPDLGPPPKRIRVEVDLVRSLIASQLPQWAGLRVEPVAKGGWDNWTFHLGTDMVVRLPSASEYAQAVEKEHQWLPVLAPSLPLPIPEPLAKGVPSLDYPHPWSVYRWLDGRTATVDRIADPVGFATELAAFLAALQSVDPTGGPRPGIHNWYRGGTLHTYDANTQHALEELEGQVDVVSVRRAWTQALKAEWDGVDQWFHGDVAEGNLLLDDAGRLAAVIDFGTCGVGDPACDLAVAWTLLSAEGRHAFRDRLEVAEPTWTRGRGWALWKTLATCWHTYDDVDEVAQFERAKHVLETILHA
ncbi:aminoglycoside phosphotransferase family protein [Nocardioides sp. 1609]|uniref:aminoglycoside phosphotransferase family protein n=1 Tax=Nocardioides sp. 1609 TaxID=2508327 RepID=UPI001FD6405A|nr:aminoglycoside phosphotransferase family protein [Nocardioides sp. 1609]